LTALTLNQEFAIDKALKLRKSIYKDLAQNERVSGYNSIPASSCHTGKLSMISVKIFITVIELTPPNLLIFSLKKLKKATISQ
jgi:hypothetical protein